MKNCKEFSEFEGFISILNFDFCFLNFEFMYSILIPDFCLLTSKVFVQRQTFYKRLNHRIMENH